MTMNITFVRHAATFLNRHGALQGGGGDSTILAEESERISRLAHELRSAYDIGAFYSSPARRAIQTADALAAGSRVIVDKRLSEPDFGIFEGLPMAEVARHPVYQDWTAHKWEYRRHGIEPWKDVSVHLTSFLKEADETHTHCIAVTHATVIKLIYLEHILRLDGMSLQSAGAQIDWFAYRKTEPNIPNLGYLTFKGEALELMHTNIEIPARFSAADLLRR